MCNTAIIILVWDRLPKLWPDRRHCQLDVPFLGERFSASYRFRVIHPKSWPKICFWEKRPISGKMCNSVTKRFVPTMIHVFLQSFVEIGKASRCVVFMIKSNRKKFLAPSSDAPKAISSRDRFRGVGGFSSLFLHSPFFCQVSSKSIQFSERYTRDVFYNRY